MSKSPAKFFPAVYAALIVVALVIAMIVSSIVTGRPVRFKGSDQIVNPPGTEFPDGPPAISEPTTPPPSN